MLHRISFNKITIRCCKLLILAILAGAILITAANYLPLNEVNKEISLEQLAAEEWLFPEVPSMTGSFGSFQSMNPTALELATDSLMIKMAAYDGEESGIKQAFRCFSTQYNEEYSRYWHGYVIILRFLLMFFDYYEIRILNGVFQFLLFSAVLYWVIKRSGRIKYALAVVTSYFLLMPPALAQCLQYSWIYYVSFGALLIYLIFKAYLETGERYIYFFMLIGAVTSYFDLLTYPLLTWGLVIVWWLLLQEEKGTVRSNGIKVIFSAISWVMGYAVMWAGKWLVGSIVLGENLFQKAFSEALLWTVDEGETAIALGDRFRTLYLNWTTYSYKLYYYILAAWLLYAVIKGLWGIKKDSRIPALFLAGLSSIVWYMTLAGHTNMHHIFTHRIYGVSIAAFLGIILICTGEKSKQPIMKYLIINGCITIFVGGISLLLMLQLRSSYNVNNYICSFEPIEANDTISMGFIPDFSKVTNINIGISAENVEGGNYYIRLFEESRVLYEEKVSAYEWAEGNLHGLPVQWELKAKKHYILQIDPREADCSTYLWITNNESTPLTECETAVVGDKNVDGQMLTAIDYWCRPVGKYNCLFWTLTITGIFWASGAVLKNIPVKAVRGSSESSPQKSSHILP